MRYLSGLTLGLGLLLGSASAQAQAVFEDPGTAYKTVAVTGSALSGDLVGATVTWSYVGGATESAIWSNLDGFYHGVRLNGFELLVANPTASSQATLFGPGWLARHFNSGKAISSITIQARGTSAAFDCHFTGGACTTELGTAMGTVGSGNGFTFKQTTFVQNVSSVYSNKVGLGTQEPVGDLFEQLTIQIGGNGLGRNANLMFGLNVDKTTSPLTLAQTPVVPEAEGWAMAAAGLLTLGLLAGGRRHARA